MLDPFIIDQLRREEKKEEEYQPRYLDLEVPDHSPNPTTKREQGNLQRGSTVIDLL